MPPKRKKSVRQKQKQRQSQSQRITINVGKTTPAKKKRSGRGRLPPPSYQQNLFPPTIIQQQAPNIAVLENQISRLTAKIQEPTDIKQPTTPLNTDTKAKTAEAQRLAGEQAEARRPGPTAENFQAPPSRARAMSQDLEGFEDEPTPSVVSSIPTDFFKSEFSFEGSDLSKPLSMRKRPPSVVSSIPTDFFKSEEPPALSLRGEQFDPVTTFGNLRPASEYVTQQLVSDRDPPKMGESGQGEGGGNIPFAESTLKRGRPFDPSKLTQATPADKRAEQQPTIQPATAPRRYTPAELKSMPEKERNVIFKQVGITGQKKIKQYTDLYKFGQV